jgi:hypothetical protein
MRTYEDFLATKDNSAPPAGFTPVGEINPKLFGFQRDVVRWGLGRGRAAAFLDCGLGKSAIELEWGRQVAEHVGKPVLMLTPLAVAKQMGREAEALTDRIPDAVEVRGSEPAEAKEEKLEAFSSGEIRVLVTKPTIAGFGLNWQHCSNMAFCGLSDSYEQQYQAIRRCWRFGQKRPVDVYFVSSEAEGAVVDNVRRKERQAAEMFDQIVAHMGEFSIGRQRRDHADYAPSMPMILPSWMESFA